MIYSYSEIADPSRRDVKIGSLRFYINDLCARRQPDGFEREGWSTGNHLQLHSLQAIASHALRPFGPVVPLESFPLDGVASVRHPIVWKLRQALLLAESESVARTAVWEYESR